ncbi:MAG TPA: sialate O-acetylesterase [Armatimonadota bacterium]|jgi:sialate O-acetylesterase
MTPDFSNLDTWVLAGQSNMEGVGQVSESLPPDEKVWAFSSAGEWEVAQDPLHRLWESYTLCHNDLIRPNLLPEEAGMSDEDLAQRFYREENAAGLGVSFGQAMAAALGQPIGLIPAAHGGTTLNQWSHEKKDQGGRSLYGAMLDRINRAGGKLQGILWYQGCSDADAVCAPTYVERMSAWIEAARRDTGIADLPLFVVQIGNLITSDNTNVAWWNMVREALAQLPEHVAHCGATTAIDLDMTDGIHIGTPGLHRLGQRMARMALRHAVHPDEPTGPRLESLEVCPAHSGLVSVRVRCSGVTGGWLPEYHIGGFEVRTPDNQPHKQAMVINANRDPEDPAAIRVLLTLPPDDQACLTYGQGYNPYCNAVDEADMPLLAFGPRKLA